MSIPYMGSKQKSAGKIYQTIKNLNPETDTICDLFCGGFAMSEYFLKNGWKVIANDKNKYVIALINQTVNKGLDEKRCLEWVNRDKFTDILKNPENYEDWYVGYIMCCWSFGNNQKNYLFGKDKEKYKQAGHELVVNCNSDLILKLIPNLPQKYIDGIIKQKDFQTRRIALLKVCTILKTRTFLLNTQLEQLEQLQQLERLQQLQQLERLEQLELYSKNYDEIEIPKNAVIYCDPPYKNTAEYKEGSFNHNQFWDWVRQKSKTNNIYISEYNAPDDFETVLEFGQNSKLSSLNNTKTIEKLFRIKK